MAPTPIHAYITHMYIPTNLQIHAHVHVYIHTCVHTCIRTYIHSCTRTYIHTCIHLNMHKGIRSYMNSYISTYIHTCMHAYVHTYIHTYVHTFIRAYMHTGWQRRRGRLIFVSHCSPKSLIISGSFAERDLQLAERDLQFKASFASYIVSLVRTYIHIHRFIRTYIHIHTYIHTIHLGMYVQVGEHAKDTLSCRSHSAKEPLIIGQRD